MLYGIWSIVVFFKGLTRGGNPIEKTYDGDEEKLMKDVLVHPQP